MFDERRKAQVLRDISAALENAANKLLAAFYTEGNENGIFTSHRMIVCNFFFLCPNPAQQPVHDGMSSLEPEVTAETLGADDRSPRTGSNFS